MKKISKKAARSKAVSNVLASLRIENLVPGEYVIRSMNACIKGQETTGDALKKVISHHVALRRS